MTEGSTAIVVQPQAMGKMAVGECGSGQHRLSQSNIWKRVMGEVPAGR